MVKVYLSPRFKKKKKTKMENKTPNSNFPIENDFRIIGL